MFPVIITFVFVDMFDTIGTLIGVSTRAGMLDEKGELPRVGQALFADAVATVVGACVGTSTVTTYVESAAGLRRGPHRFNGPSSGILFLCALFISPIAKIVPSVATAPALVMVGVFMMQSLKNLNFDDLTEITPRVSRYLRCPLLTP